MKTSDFDYHLPPELVAQEPLPDRSASRMMVLDRAGGNLAHRNVSELPTFLRPGDLIVLNDTKVIPARLIGRKEPTGGRVELLLLEELPSGAWLAMHRATGRLAAGTVISFPDMEMGLRVDEFRDGGLAVVSALDGGSVSDIMEKAGSVPLPPYVRRPAGVLPSDSERYQTVYADRPGAVAAPTAGLHFTPELLRAVSQTGAHVAKVTLHVGPGTFKPVTAEDAAEHRMESERYEISSETADLVNRTRAAGGRIIAVGTTAVRTLETKASDDGTVKAGSGRTDIFIRPPYRFKCVNGLLTNFHLPRSTLIMLVCAFAGHERVMSAYHEAVTLRYRFHSYGDCMLIT